MREPIMTTKGTNGVSKISATVSLIIDLLVLLFGNFMIFGEINSMPKYLQDTALEEAAGYIVLVWVIFLVVFLFTMYQLYGCKSYVDVYEDRLEGKAIMNFYPLSDVSLVWNQITNVTYSGTKLFVHTPGGKYKIVTDSKTAMAVFEYYKSRSCERMGV